MRTGFLAVVCMLLCGQAFAGPPTQIPPALYSAFTMQNQVPVSHWYIDDSCPAKLPVFTKQQVDANLLRVAKKGQGFYGITDTYLYCTLDAYRDYIQDKSVAIIGSITPWYESVILFYGGKPTTIEYNVIISQDPRLEVLTVQEFEKNPRKFDAILSISSLEHDGLGRYGDPINPNGDLQTMTKLKSMLKENGLFILSVPMGKDHLWWNAHRIYGRLRFPKLVKEWKCIDSFGFRDGDLDYNAGIEAYRHQPIFVLQPR